MGTSFKAGKKEVKVWLEKYPTTTRVLDVGAGCGTYHDLVGCHFETMHAIEVFAPSIDKYKLRDKYDAVYHQSVVDFNSFDKYDLVIMGDVLEHLSVTDAQAVLNKIKCPVMVAVPFEHQQSSIKGNTAERHLQPDLTPARFDELYPGFNPIHMKKRSKQSLAKGVKGEYSYGYYGRQ